MRLGALAAAAMVCTIARSAPAYNYESPVGDGCHERMSAAALRLVRADMPQAGPLPNTETDQLIIDDVTFSLPADMRDIGAVALFIGVRDNDLKGHSGIDTQHLAGVHGDEATQKEHCLRRSTHDYEAGSEAAVAECRGFVRERLLQAAQGLDDQGRPDPLRRTELELSLAFRGQIDAQLPTFYLRLGQALHTVQDSFSHTFRTEDHRRITVALNWVDQVAEELVVSRDGPAHMRDLDLCEEIDEFRRTRFQVAEEATEAMMRAVLAPPDERVAAIDAALAEYMSFEPGCNAGNDWCNATELRYEDGLCACRLPGAPDRRPGWGWLLVGLGAALLWRRRAAALALAGAASLPSSAEAHDVPDRSGFGLSSNFSASVDNGALAWALGGRYAVDHHWVFGIDVEYNPWFSFEAQRLARGAFNSYATFIYRHAIGSGFSLRTTVNAGASVLLFDLVGAPKGSTGPLVGGSLLGISYHLGGDFDFILDPAHVILAVPQIQGAPFAYYQYRLTLGIQWGA